MASSKPSPLLLLSLISLSFLLNPTNGLNCSSQTFSNNRLFHSCNDLPHLNSSLHWTYNASKSSIRIAFLAPPAKSNGWIAWAINPTAKGMIGAQSLIAFHQSNGSITVQTFNISAYGPIQPSKISIEVSDLEGEFSNGVMTIFATVVLPKNGTKLNQVWQVGSSATDGIPDKHDFGPENLNSLGTLDVLKGQKSNSTVTGGKQQQNNGTLSAGGNQNSTMNGRNSTTSSPSSSLMYSSRVSFPSLFVAIVMLFWSV